MARLVKKARSMADRWAARLGYVSQADAEKVVAAAVEHGEWRAAKALLSAVSADRKTAKAKKVSQATGQQQVLLSAAVTSEAEVLHAAGLSDAALVAWRDRRQGNLRAKHAAPVDADREPDA